MIVTGIPQARLIWFPFSSDASFLTHSQSHKVLVFTSLVQPTASYTLWPPLCSVILSGSCLWSPLGSELTLHLGEHFLASFHELYPSRVSFFLIVPNVSGLPLFQQLSFSLCSPQNLACLLHLGLFRLAQAALHKNIKRAHSISLLSHLNQIPKLINSKRVRWQRNTSRGRANVGQIVAPIHICSVESMHWCTSLQNCSDPRHPSTGPLDPANVTHHRPFCHPLQGKPLL